MPIKVTKNWSGSSLRKTTTWEAVETWTVTGTASKAAAIDAAVAHNSGHEDNPLMRCAERDAAPMKGPMAWTVRAVYRYGDQGSGSDDALNEPPSFFPDYETLSVPFDRDVDGNPVVNSAGDPFDPPLCDDETVFVLICERNVPMFNISMGLTFTNAVNSNAGSLPGAGSYAARQALCKYYKPVGAWRSGDPFVRVQAAIAFRQGTNPWDHHVKDQGRNSWHDTGGKKPGAIVDPLTGEQVGVDVALDGKGKPIKTEWKITNQKKAPVDNPTLPAGLVVDDTRSSPTGKILEWKKKRAVNFSGLPF